MKATSLSVNLWAGCQAKCPFCISRTTWKSGVHDNETLLDSLRPAINLMKWHSVDTMLITSNGEPLTVDEDVSRVLRSAQEAGVPIVELQTNGQLATPAMLEHFHDRGLRVLALSVADPDPARSAKVMGLPDDYNYTDTIRMAKDAGLMARVSLNLLDMQFEGDMERSFRKYVRSLADMGVEQVTVRELGLPSTVKGGSMAEKVASWIKEHNHPHSAYFLANLLKAVGEPLRKLSYGNMVYAFEGCAVAVASCMSSSPNPEEIRSLILMPDGGVYYDWDHQPASRIL